MKPLALLALVFAFTAPALAQRVPAGGTVCDFVAANAGGQLEGLGEPKGRIGVYEAQNVFADMLVKAAIADVDGDGDLETLSINPFSGTMRGDTGVVYGSASLEGHRLYSDDDDIRWSHVARWLPFGGKWYLVYFEDEQLEQATAVVAVTREPGLACRLDADFDEKAIPYSSNAAVLAAFNALMAEKPLRFWEIRGQADPLTAADRAYLIANTGRRDEPMKDEGEALGAWSISIDPKASLRAVDIDGDGVRERMAFVSVSSGAGRGCSALFLELLPPEGKAAPDPAQRDLVRKMQGIEWDGFLPAPCGNYSDLVEIGGRGYLYINRVGDSNRERMLKFVKDGAERVEIRSTFTPTHTVTFDREKAPK